MTEDVYRALRCTVLDRFDHWVDVLEMRWVEIHTVTVSGSRADDEKCCADTDAMWQYRSAKVTFYLRPLATMTLQDIDSVIVHELVHVLLSSMESAVAGKHTDQCELAVENVARAILAIQKGDK